MHGKALEIRATASTHFPASYFSVPIMDIVSHVYPFLDVARFSYTISTGQDNDMLATASRVGVALCGDSSTQEQ